MAVQQQQSQLAARLGGRIAEANAEYATAPIDVGFKRLPPGIKDGVAKLQSLSMKFYGNDEKIVALRGQEYFHAVAVVKKPKVFTYPNGESETVEGTQIFLRVPMCDVPDNPQTKRKGSTFKENWFTFQNFFKCFGIGAAPFNPTTDPTGAKSWAYWMGAIQTLAQRCAGPNAPHFKFQTRGWTPPALPGQPAPKEIVFEDWGEQCEWKDDFDPAGGMSDSTPASVQPDAHQAPPGAPYVPPVPQAPTQPFDGDIAPPKAQDDAISDEVDALVEIAMGDPEGATSEGTAAHARLEELAWAAGWTREQTSTASDWMTVGEMARTPPSADEEPAEAETEYPAVGSKHKFCKRDKDGNKLIDGRSSKPFPAQEVEVVTVDNQAQTCTLKSKDGRDIIDIRTKKPVVVKFEWLE